MTTTQAAGRSQIPKRTIIAAINRGDLPAQKLPGVTGSFLISPADFDTWVLERQAKAAS